MGVEKVQVGDTFEAVGYRAVNMTDPSGICLEYWDLWNQANVTLIADEAEKIDQSPDIMSTLKTGYQFKSKVAKVNTEQLVSRNSSIRIALR